MTENEAKLKWCPGAQPVIGEGLVVVAKERQASCDLEKDRIGQRCIASDCMMWQWDEEINREAMEEEGPGADFEGHCGLAR